MTNTPQTSFLIGGVRIRLLDIRGTVEECGVQSVLLQNGMKVKITIEEGERLKRLYKAYADDFLKRRDKP